jgi:uncharacterized protein YdaL
MSIAAESLKNTIIALENAKAFYDAGNKCKIPKEHCHRFSKDGTCENCYLGERNVNNLLDRIEKNRDRIDLHLIVTGQAGE